LQHDARDLFLGDNGRATSAPGNAAPRASAPAEFQRPAAVRREFLRKQLAKWNQWSMHFNPLAFIVHEGLNHLNDLVVGVHHRVLKRIDRRPLCTLVLLQHLLRLDDFDDRPDGFSFAADVPHGDHGSRVGGRFGSCRLA